MELSEGRLKNNPNDTQALYSLGVTYGLRANWSFLVRKSWRDALHDATTARTLHAKIPPLDPNNYDALLVPGAHDYIVGSLPTFTKCSDSLSDIAATRKRAFGHFTLWRKKENATRATPKYFYALSTGVSRGGKRRLPCSTI